jgi:hypothetical protein
VVADIRAAVSLAVVVHQAYVLAAHEEDLTLTGMEAA